MYKLFLAVFALALYCGQTSATNIFGKELVQNLDTCLARLPPRLTGEASTWAAVSTTRWYLKYADEIFFNRLSDIFLTGKENSPLREVRPYFDAPCWTDTSQSYIVDQAVSENITSGALGITIPMSVTLHSTGLVTAVYHLPNSQTPALTVNWSMVLTNQQTYIVTVFCLPEGYFGWQVWATRPELDADSIREIKKYLNSVGFDDKLSAVTTYRASTCTNAPLL